MSLDTDLAVDAAIVVLARKLKILIKKKRRKPKKWARKWIQWREGERLGGSRAILCEFADEDPLEYKKYMTMSKEKFEELLSLVDPIISRQDTPMRIALSSRIKLQIIGFWRPEIALHLSPISSEFQSLLFHYFCQEYSKQPLESWVTTCRYILLCNFCVNNIRLHLT